MGSVMDIRIRNSKKVEKDFKSRIQTISFPEHHEILSDSIQEQMMMDGSVQFICWLHSIKCVNYS
jgi:hypothetical protein